MNYTLSEQNVLDRLDIPDFKHMTKNKIVDFVSMMPYMDPEVAKAALEQVPNFKELAIEIVQAYKDIVDRAMESNANSQDAFYAGCRITLEALQEELRVDSLDALERERIEDRMLEVVRMMSAKDTENKHFLLSEQFVFGLFGAFALGALASVFGSNIHISSSGGNAHHRLNHRR